MTRRFSRSSASIHKLNRGIIILETHVPCDVTRINISFLWPGLTVTGGVACIVLQQREGMRKANVFSSVSVAESPSKFKRYRAPFVGHSRILEGRICRRRPPLRIRVELQIAGRTHENIWGNACADCGRSGTGAQNQYYNFYCFYFPWKRALCT